MNCYYHPHEEGVVTCGKCGVALCRECEQKAYFRTENGKGRALCKRCSLQAAQEIVDYEEKWLKKRAIKLGVMGALIVFGILYSMFSKNGVGTTIICFILASLVANIGNDANPQSIKSQIVDAELQVHHPISHLIGSFIGYTILAPFLLIANVIGYLRTKSDYKKDLANLEEAKALAAEK